ncbi:MAG TPA: hypothetical protein IAA32_03625 [Candidatus Butyricicoccus stercorigallinarum]|nr:hypothetical protein [Candidatus Butyricicoccus stercorigallinarum]
MRENAASAAKWTLAALAVQIASAACLSVPGAPVGLALMAVCYLMNGWAAWRLRCFAALGASLVGCVLTLLLPDGTDPAWIGNMLVNLLFLLIYLPMQRRWDGKLRAADVSEQTLRIGRTWALVTLIQRGASMLGFLPLFEGQAELSAAQGAYTALFTMQVTFEMVALLAAVVSYVWMVRYLWRAKTLLKEQVAP